MFFQPPNSLAVRWLGADWKSLGVFELQEETSVKTRKTSQQLDRAVSKPGRQVACGGLGLSTLGLTFPRLDQTGTLTLAVLYTVSTPRTQSQA